MTNNSVPLLSQCKAGFGYMAYDIARSVAEKQTVETLLYSSFASSLACYF